jgi:aminoglycoside phosphotransferase family enzyme/predicted kinase
MATGLDLARVKELARGAGLEVEETHISLVLLSATEVFKLKKPVTMGFLDFSNPEARRAACLAEVELNSRLAPGVYLGVAPVGIDRSGVLRLGEDAGGEATEGVEWAVRMRRLPREARADFLLAHGRLGRAELQRVATRIAAFHQSARCDRHTVSFGSPAAIRRNVEENFDQAAGLLGRYLDAESVREVEGWQLDFLARNPDLFAARAARGRVRDGHGDLRLDHVYLGAGVPEPDGLAVIDCIEFNERFRYADVCCDVAFLAMDLSAHLRVDLAEAFLAEYARASDDYDLYALVDFYESYRAFVRGKISAITAELPGQEHGAAERARDDARRFFRLAQASERRALLGPWLVAVCGSIATGKSTVAGRLADRLGGPVIDADRARKHLLGRPHTAPLHHPPFRGAYEPGISLQVYAELLRRAEVVVRSGRPAVLDASFRSRAERGHVRSLARRLRVPLLFVECRAPRQMIEARLRERAARTGVSDGRLEILDDFVASFEEITELPREQHVVLDTTLPIEASLVPACEALPRWPGGPLP